MLVTVLSVADASVLIRKEYKLLMDQYIFHSSFVLQSPVNDIVSGNIHIGNDSMRRNRTLHHRIQVIWLKKVKQPTIDAPWPPRQ